MKNDIRLFINDREIEFSADPKILLNYKEKELHNPTVVRNNYTKQITVPGTPQNNKVFDHIWSLERIQDGNFNPIRKTDFELYVNDELFQRGYVKLDKITRTNNTTNYALTLYGNLGSFFYNLTYDEADYGNTKKTLASLFYSTDTDSEPSLDFTIDKDAVYEAWGQIAGFGTSSNPRWDVINFIPALNGIPGDFDASKVLINNKNLGGGFNSGVTVDGNYYRPVINGVLNTSGYSMGEAEGDLHEWQTRDLRSYNQRPCINMRRIIQACCQPENNGGYQVKLDEHFFHDRNPYYANAWVTLPMLKDLEGVGGGETYDITGATISNPSTQYDSRMYQVGFTSPAASLNNVRMSVSVRFNPDSTTSASKLYPSHTFHASNATGSDHVEDAEWNCGVVMQMFALGQGGEVVGQSKAYLLGGSKYYYRYGDPMWDKFWDPELFNGDIGVQPDYEFVQGYFKKISGKYVFVNPDGDQTDIQFTFSAPNDFASLVLKVKTPRGEYVDYASAGWESSTENYNNTVRNCYTTTATTQSGNYTYAQAAASGRVSGDYSFVVTSFEGVATDYEGMFSGTRITKDRLLTSEHSPADYLLSYCKLFGLYFYYDSTEDPDDLDRYPSGVVHIMDRDTFYTDEVVDLSKMIDWGRNVEITPAMADAKWYKFDVDHIDSELETGYKEQFGREYGAMYVNTNYNFDNNTTNLYDGNVFKSATMALEKDKYYKKTTNGLPVYQYNGFSYVLYYRASSDDEFTTYEFDKTAMTTTGFQSVNPEYDYYNAFPMLQLHGEDNSPVDGSNILVFFKNAVEAGADYWLTDDLPEMVYLNDATPCWIMTNSETDAAGATIAKRLNYFPYFTRDLIFSGNYGNVIHSWNFGHPQVIYSPKTYTTFGDSIYDVCWRNYISDLYSVDTRKLTCYVRAEMDERPWPYWLRRFYWFENSIWMLNEIKDLNVGSFDTTKMEFIKVQDMDNYKLDRIDYFGNNGIVLNQSTIACGAGSVTGVVRVQGGGRWSAGEYITGRDGDGNTYRLASDTHMTPYSGNAETTNFTVSVPANTGDTSIVWTVSIFVNYTQTYRATFTQMTCDTGSSISISPADRSVNSPSGTTTYSVSSNRVSNIQVSSDSNWATAVLSNGTVTVTYSKNTTAYDRQATITVSGMGDDGLITDTATLTQYGIGNIYVNPEDLVFEYNDNSTKTLALTSGDEWTTTINDN